MNWNMSPKYAVEGSAGLLCQPKTKSSSTFFLLEAAWVCEKQNQKHKPPKQQIPPKNTNPTNNKHQTTPSNTVMIARPRVKYETICFFHRLPRSVKARAVRIGSYATERCTKWTSYTVYGTWYSVGRPIKTSKQGNKHNKTKGHPQKCTSCYNSRYATTVLFWVVFVLVEDILSFAFSPVLQQLEISWPTMPRARSALAPENLLQLITLVMAASSDFCTLVLHSEIWVCLYRGSRSALCNSTWLNRFIQVWFGLAAYLLSGLFTLRHHPKLTCNIGLCIFTDVVFPNGDHYSFMVLPAWW